IVGSLLLQQEGDAVRAQQHFAFGVIDQANPVTLAFAAAAAINELLGIAVIMNIDCTCDHFNLVSCRLISVFDSPYVKEIAYPKSVIPACFKRESRRSETGPPI